MSHIIGSDSHIHLAKWLHKPIRVIFKAQKGVGVRQLSMTISKVSPHISEKSCQKSVAIRVTLRSTLLSFCQICMTIITHLCYILFLVAHVDTLFLYYNWLSLVSRDASAAFAPGLARQHLDSVLGSPANSHDHTAHPMVMGVSNRLRETHSALLFCTVLLLSTTATGSHTMASHALFPPLDTVSLTSYPCSSIRGPKNSRG